MKTFQSTSRYKQHKASVGCRKMKMKMKKSNTTIIALVIGLAPLIAVTTTTITTIPQTAYAQLVEIEQEAESENGVHTGSISVKVEPQGEPDDTPAHRGELSFELPNGVTKERVIESAPQSSGAAATGQGGQDILTFDFGDVDP